MAEQAYQSAPTPAYPNGYTISQQEQTGEGAPAPLDAQMSMLLGALTELVLLVDNLEPPAALRAIRPDNPGKAEGLTALIAACQSETGALGMALRDIAQRVGRL